MRAVQLTIGFPKVTNQMISGAESIMSMRIEDVTSGITEDRDEVPRLETNPTTLTITIRLLIRLDKR